MTPKPFFVPGARPGASETLYQMIARDFLPEMGGTPPADRLRRKIRSLTFNHDGRRWTATVGEPTVGHWIGNPRRDEPRTITDPAVVMAIYPGPPTYRIVLNTHPFNGPLSRWSNPFMASKNAMVTYFDDTQPAVE